MSQKITPPTPDFTKEDVEILQCETLYQGFFRAEKMTLRHRLFRGGWTTPMAREIFVRGEAVGVLLYDKARDLIGLVEQFRIGALAEPHTPWLWKWWREWWRQERHLRKWLGASFWRKLPSITPSWNIFAIIYPARAAVMRRCT